MKLAGITIRIYWNRIAIFYLSSILKKKLKQFCTFEEFWTLAAEIEGISNSSPLLPSLFDPNVIEALVPNSKL